MSSLTPKISDSKIYTIEELEELDIDFDYLDKEVFGFNNDEIIDIDINKIKIKYTADIENAEYKAKNNGYSKWAKTVSFEEPVEISIDEEGICYIEDGHHRYTARKILNEISKKNIHLKVHIELKGNPLRAFVAKQKEFHSKKDIKKKKSKFLNP